MVTEMFVHELDMPPMAYFDIPLDMPDDVNQALHGRKTLRVVPHELRAGPFKTQQQADEQSKLGVEMIRQRLLTVGGGIIWWRTRPEVSKQHGSGGWRFYARCGTSPTLPDSFWSQMGSRDV